MPMYRYVCKKCGFEEVYIHNSDMTLSVECEKCKEKMEKEIPKNVSVKFNGSGFYSTEHKK